jgi:hypothetical protein
MSDQTRVLKSNREDIPHDVLALADVVHALPTEQRQDIDPVLDQVIDSSRRRRRILLLVQDALSQLRLDMKYLTFDLEATRRERDELRRKLDETP